MQIAALREKAGLSQKDLARKLKTSQQQISRLESPSYEGHSLSMLRRVVRVLSVKVRVVLEPEDAMQGGRPEESPTTIDSRRDEPHRREEGADAARIAGEQVQMGDMGCIRESLARKTSR